MRRFLTIIFLYITSITLAQNAGSAKKVTEKYPPPNCILLENNIYMDATEIGNIHYLEYLYRLKRDSSELVYNQALPYNHDLTWSLIPKDSLEVLKYYQEDRYLRYPGFRYNPVVGITKKQAENYAQWRSQIVTITVNNKLKKADKPFRINYKYRLPTEQEWEQAAYGGLNSSLFPYGMQFTKSPVEKDWIKRFENGEVVPDSVLFYQFNCLQPVKPKTRFKTTEYIYSYRPNNAGFYNMIGNVAELIEGADFAKGGSWMHEKQDCEIQDRQKYDCPAEWLGFRCACEVTVEEMKVTSPPDTLTAGTDSCSFIEKRKKADHVPNIKKVYAAFTIKNNNAFNFKVNDIMILENDTIGVKTDLKNRRFKKPGYEIKPILNGGNGYDYYKAELVAVNGPYVTSTEIKSDTGQILIRESDNLFMYDYIVVTIFKKEKGFGGMLTSSVARKLW